MRRLTNLIKVEQLSEDLLIFLRTFLPEEKIPKSENMPKIIELWKECMFEVIDESLGDKWIIGLWEKCKIHHKRYKVQTADP